MSTSTRSQSTVRQSGPGASHENAKARHHRTDWTARTNQALTGQFAAAARPPLSIPNGPRRSGAGCKMSSAVVPTHGLQASLEPDATAP